MAQCTAHRRKSGGVRCRKQALVGRTVCAQHGGKTPRGFALPQTTTGKHSRSLPVRMAARYAAAREDPKLLEQRDEIALLDARIVDVLKRVDTGESGHLWKTLREAWRAITAAQVAGDALQLTAAVETVGALVKRGRDDTYAWRDIRQMLQERRQLVESERKRLVELQQTITAEQAMMLFGIITDTIRRYVTDRSALAAIGAEFERLAANGTGAQPLTVGAVTVDGPANDG